MPVIRGEQNQWQTGNINGAAHAIEKCGSDTGHAVRAVAFCDTAETATLLVQALYLLWSIHRDNIASEREPEIKALLERAGLI